MLSCNTPREVSVSDETKPEFTNDTVRISNEDLEYEVIIIDPGFYNWMNTNARPKESFTQSFLEGRNILFVTEWNRRALNPQQYSPNLYIMQINYNSTIDYGFDVNYLLYNYFIYFQNTYKQQLAGYVGRM